MARLAEAERVARQVVAAGRARALVASRTESETNTQYVMGLRASLSTDAELAAGVVHLETMGTSDLSGASWWRTNQATYPNSREIDDLDPGFRSRVVDFIGSLRNSGAGVTVNSTLRNEIRAHLMHFSWSVAYGEVAPADVPAKSGLTFEWDHGDLEKSRKAAREMVELFGMAPNASLTSNHTRGKAIDMNISWKDTLVMTRPAPLLARIESRPRTGQNRDLHEIGANVFGGKKLVSNPPHWSYNGR